MEKSHVSFDTKICIATGRQFESGSLLLETKVEKGKLLKRLDRNTVTGFGISPEVQEKIDEEYVVVVGVDGDKSEKEANGSVKPSGAYRTGEIAYIKKDVFGKIFNVSMTNPIVFCDQEVIKELVQLEKRSAK